MMKLRVLAAAAVLAGVTALSTPSPADDFELVEVPSVTEFPLAQLKAKSIVFADHPGDDLVDKAVGFIRYEDWANARPNHRQFLSLYPGYAEPNVDLVINGVRRHYRERLHMYVAEARFIVPRPPGSIDIPRLATLPFIQKLDPAIQHRLLKADDPPRPQTPKVVHNQNPQRRWCEGRPIVICLRSSYKLEGRLPTGIQLANRIREGSRHISDTLEFDSEVTVLSPDEINELGIARLTRLDTPAAGALEQSIFYVNQVMQFGKLLAVFQAHPEDAKKTVVSVFTALAIESSLLGKQKQYAKVPVLRNLVPAQVLAGKSSFTSGHSLSAGLPVYARNQIKAIAGLLETGSKAAPTSSADPVR
jgi:hypothetical protein